MTGSEEVAHRAKQVAGPVPTFSLQGKAAMKMAVQIAEEWTLGPIVSSHVTTGGADALVQPFYDSNLPYQHVSPFLADIEDVRDPFRLEFSAILENEVQYGQQIVDDPAFEDNFKAAFERRLVKAAKKEAKTATVEEGDGRGLFQRFLERRRYARGDRISKPLSKFIDVGGSELATAVKDEATRWRLVEGEGPADDESCHFFTRPGARELFEEIYRPPTFKGRKAASIAQLVTIDVMAMMLGAERRVKSQGYEKKILAFCSEMADSLAVTNGQPCQCCWIVDIGGLMDEEELSTGESGEKEPGEKALEAAAGGAAEDESDEETEEEGRDDEEGDQREGKDGDDD